MPWKVRDIVSERMLFMNRLESGERMSDLCRDFGISRKTGYKIRDRYRRFGPEGLFDQSRRPQRSPWRTPEEIQKLVLALRRKQPSWGPKKLKSSLERAHPDLQFPAHSTIGEILKRHGLVKPRRRRSRRAHASTQLRQSRSPNEVWCADFKGEFPLRNRRYCYPLTISDHNSRYLLSCEALESTRGQGVRAVFELTFRRYGLPEAIRTDNGSPFASTGLFGLTTLSVWLLRLGIELERIEPGHPEQNGRHERMHLTLKAEATRPAGANLLQQQEKFDRFEEIYNHQRPHEALGMRTPSELYRPSEREYPEILPEVEYPLHDKEREVSSDGRIRVVRKQPFYLGSALAGERVGLREVEDGRWLISFLQYDLGYYDERARRFEHLQ